MRYLWEKKGLPADLHWTPLPRTLPSTSPPNCGLHPPLTLLVQPTPLSHLCPPLSPLPLLHHPWLLNPWRSTWISLCLRQCPKSRSTPPSPRPTATPQWSPSSRGWWGTGAVLGGEKLSIDILISLCLCFCFSHHWRCVHTVMPDFAWEWHIFSV